MTAMRDAHTDSSRDGSGQTRKEDVGYALSFAPVSVEEEKRDHGYQPGDTPTGAKKALPMPTGNAR